MLYTHIMIADCCYYLECKKIILYKYDKARNINRTVIQIRYIFL